MPAAQAAQRQAHHFAAEARDGRRICALIGRRSQRSLTQDEAKRKASERGVKGGAYHATSPREARRIGCFYGIRGQARQGTRRTRPKAHSSATRMTFPVIRRRLHMSYSPCCGQHFRTVRSMAETSRHTVSTPPAQLRVRHSRHRPPELAGAGLENTRTAPACSRSRLTYIPSASRARERSSNLKNTLFVCVVPPPPSPPLCFPPCTLTNMAFTAAVRATITSLVNFPSFHAPRRRM